MQAHLAWRRAGSAELEVEFDVPSGSVTREGQDRATRESIRDHAEALEAAGLSE